MILSQGFPPVSHADARLVILGSMPGTASLDAGQYYAFPRNAFWKIMGELCGAGPDLVYEQRLQKLLAHRIALWDVIASCRRPGSLDSSIAREDMVTNDFGQFFAEHPRISHVYFNGQTAARLFRSKVQAGLQVELEFHTLPSTSPAHAAKNYAEKLGAWSILKNISNVMETPGKKMDSGIRRNDE